MTESLRSLTEILFCLTKLSKLMSDFSCWLVKLADREVAGDMRGGVLLYR